MAGQRLAARRRTTTEPYAGVTIIERTETTPRAVRLHVARIDLSRARRARGAHAGRRGRSRRFGRPPLEHVRAAGAQVGVNAHFFLPFPSPTPEADLIGLAVSEGRVISTFESPAQSYALVADAPAIHIDRSNRASLVRVAMEPRRAGGRPSRGPRRS